VRRLLLAAVVMMAAAPSARGDRYVETWLGTWSGKATWKGCTVEGAEQLSVKVAWHDGMLWIDGAALYETLGEVAPDGRDGNVLAFETDDLSVELRPARPAKGKKRAKPATLTFTTAAQCKMTAKLTRDGSTGDAACDGLAALTEVAASCELEVPAADERSCKVRGDELRERLVAQDCLRPEHDPADLPACREVWHLAQRIMRCEQASVSFKQGALESTADLRHGLRNYDDALAIEKCEEYAQILRDTADDILHCP
jgi:hypothetical protein